MSDSHSSLNNHPNIEGLTLFTAEPAPHEHKVHEHGAYSVIGLTHGSKHFHHQGDTVTVHANQIAIANPGELHGCGPIEGEPWAHRTWYLSAELMQEIAGSLGISATVCLQTPVIKDETLAKALIDAHTQCNQEVDLLESQSIALEALSRLVEEYGDGKTDDEQQNQSNAAQRVKLYEEWLPNNIDQTVELADLANLAGVKRNQVIKDFKAIKGVTPGNFFRLLRLKHAKDAIRNGANLAQASNDSGFADQSHFTREFRAAFGITPNHFKQLAKNSDHNVPL